MGSARGERMCTRCLLHGSRTARAAFDRDLRPSCGDGRRTSAGWRREGGLARSKTPHVSRRAVGAPTRCHPRPIRTPPRSHPWTVCPRSCSGPRVIRHPSHSRPRAIRGLSQRRTRASTRLGPEDGKRHMPRTHGGRLADGSRFGHVSFSGRHSTQWAGVARTRVGWRGAGSVLCDSTLQVTSPQASRRVTRPPPERRTGDVRESSARRGAPRRCHGRPSCRHAAVQRTRIVPRPSRANPRCVSQAIRLGAKSAAARGRAATERGKEAITEGSTEVAAEGKIKGLAPSCA